MPQPLEETERPFQIKKIPRKLFLVYLPENTFLKFCSKIAYCIALEFDFEIFKNFLSWLGGGVEEDDGLNKIRIVIGNSKFKSTDLRGIPGKQKEKL